MEALEATGLYRLLRAAGVHLHAADQSIGARRASADFAGVPPHMMPAMFTCARTGGWSAHIIEQKKTGRLVRPSARYVGPPPRRPEEVEGWDDIAHT